MLDASASFGWFIKLFKTTQFYLKTNLLIDTLPVGTPSII